MHPHTLGPLDGEVDPFARMAKRMGLELWCRYEMYNVGGRYTAMDEKVVKLIC